MVHPRKLQETPAINAHQNTSRFVALPIPTGKKGKQHNAVMLLGGKLHHAICADTSKLLTTYSPLEDLYACPLRGSKNARLLLQLKIENATSGCEKKQKHQSPERQIQCELGPKPAWSWHRQFDFGFRPPSNCSKRTPGERSGIRRELSGPRSLSARLPMDCLSGAQGPGNQLSPRFTPDPTTGPHVRAGLRFNSSHALRRLLEPLLGDVLAGYLPAPPPPKTTVVPKRESQRKIQK